MAYRDLTPFGSYLAGLMEKCGFHRQLDLVKASGLSASTISRMMFSDEYVPDTRTFERLAAALNVNTAEVVLRHGSKTSDLGQPLDILLVEAHRMLAPDSPLSEAQQAHLRQLLDAVLAGFRPTMAMAWRDERAKPRAAAEPAATDPPDPPKRSLAEVRTTGKPESTRETLRRISGGDPGRARPIVPDGPDTPSGRLA